ncbi:hypothetical protein Pcinc_038244 [Petrolisthes cinctipes]|uniref:Uncharacterized protein n=1 Tax=Petrolisthes cinctipes TaxID=88211 RepID=A0AAE1EKL0_PETCI|nr:hypothetical protein Pcinc_038244 [Petrolisthes cinctipes]
MRSGYLYWSEEEMTLWPRGEDQCGDAEKPSDLEMNPSWLWREAVGEGLRGHNTTVEEQGTVGSAQSEAQGGRGEDIGDTANTVAKQYSLQNRFD